MTRWRVSALVLALGACAARAHPVACPAGCEGTRIHDIQGAGHRSPLAGRRVAGVIGVVTARTEGGFFMQDPHPDDDPATSEAIFVFTTGPPAVRPGDAVVVAGRVNEFRPGGRAGARNLTTTELAAPAVTVESSGNPLPAPVVVGPGGRAPPTAVMVDASGDVERSGLFDPAGAGLDFFESLEAMRVQISDATAVGPTGPTGELAVVVAGADVRTARGGLVVRPDDFNPERILLGGLFVPAPVANVGDRLPGPVVGVVDYGAGHYRLEPTEPYAVVPGGLAQEETEAPAPGQLALATFNVENLDPTDPPGKFEALAALVVRNLRSPDLLALEEIQDDSGPAQDGTVGARLTLARLIAAIHAAGGPLYDARQIDPLDGTTGGEPGGNIRCAFLFRTDRGLAFVDRPGAEAITAEAVVAGPGGVALRFSPGLVDPQNGAFAGSRRPLAAELTFGPHHLFAIANHFASKRGDDPLCGRYQPPGQSSRPVRLQQARIVHDFVAEILQADPAAEVVVMGDLNDFPFSPTLSALEGTQLTNLVDRLPLPERYSYVFEGNSQALDHILLSPALMAAPHAYDIVHANAEFATQASDHDPQVVRLY